MIRVANISFRLATLVSRFLFMFFLAKMMAPVQIANYGIFTVSIGYALYFVGLDFHAYVTREILRSDADQRGRMLKGQVALSTAVYILIFPLSFVFFKSQGWEIHMIIWYFPILVLELLNQEISRILVVLSEQLMASALTFVRQGIWPILVVLIMQYEERARELDTVMALWMLAGITAAFVGVWKLSSLNISGWYLPIDWKWVRKGVSISVAFLLATMALRGLQTFDRYAIENLDDVDLLAAYVVLIGIANTLPLFLDAGVFAFSYPALITLHHENKRGAARKQVGIMLFQTIAVCAIFAVVSIFALPHLLDWIENPVYMNASHLYPWILAAIVLNGMGMVPHYALYSMRKDKPIIFSQVAGLVLFLSYLLFNTGSFSVNTIIGGLILSYSVIAVWKAMAYLLVIRYDIHSEKQSGTSESRVF